MCDKTQVKQIKTNYTDIGQNPSKTNKDKLYRCGQ